MITRRFIAAAGMLALAGSVLASSVVGTWKGKIQMQAPPAKPGMTPQQKDMMDKAMASLKTMSIQMNFKADKTYTVNIQGGPMQTKPQQQTGTWSQSGNTITVKDSKNGPGSHEQKLTMSANGKTMTMVPPGAPGMKMKIVFTR